MSTVIICGSRDWTLEGPIRSYLQTLPRDTVIVHGAARGADRIAGTLAREMGFAVREYPAEWERFGLSAGHRRNQQMLETEHPETVAAFKTKRISKGTDNMLSIARRARVMTISFLLSEDGERLVCEKQEPSERAPLRSIKATIQAAQKMHAIWGHFTQKSLDFQ